jgi:hypothetical protein
MNSNLLSWWGILGMPLPFMVWRVPHVSLWGMPCAPLSPKTLLPLSLVARVQKMIYLGCICDMGFDWQPCVLLSLMGGVWALRHLCLLDAPTFLLLGVLVRGPQVQKSIY